MPTTIEIYADFTCPWSYIGLSRVAQLEKAHPVHLSWKPYMLRPEIPEGGIPLTSILPPERFERAETAIREAAQAAGLPLNRPDLLPNTRHAHEIGFFAESKNLIDAYYRAVFSAYFAHARNIGDVEVLAEIGEEVGMARDEIRETLRTGRYRAQVDRSADEAFGQGIRSVPNFIFSTGKRFSGALPYDAFLHAVEA